MGRFDPAYDVSSYLNFPNDSEDEDGMTPTPTEDEDRDIKQGPLSPPASSTGGDAIDEDEQEDEDLYGTTNDEYWKTRRHSTSLDSPINPQWLSSSNAPPRRSSVDSHQHHPSPPTSDDAKSPGAPRSILESIQERNEQLIKTSTNAKSSKSFPLLPDLLSLKTGDDEDEKILQSEEGKRLNPKERRQLRNKVSARNFRVRRKGTYY